MWAGILRALLKVGPMLSGEARIWGGKVAFQTRFWAREGAETYLHGTTLSDFAIGRSWLWDEAGMKVTPTFLYPIFDLEAATTCPGCGLGTKLR